MTSDDSGSEIAVSPDGKALTATFSDLEASSESGVSSNATRLVMPLTGGAQNAKITVYVLGEALTRHATARLILTLNGNTVVKDFPAGIDDSYNEPLEVPAIPGSASQLSLAIDEQPNSHKGIAYINVRSIDAEIS